MGEQPSGYPCLAPTHGCPLPSTPGAGEEPSPAQLTHILIVPSHAASHSRASPGCVVLCWGAQESQANPIWSDPLEAPAIPRLLGAHPAWHWHRRAFPRGCGGEQWLLDLPMAGAVPAFGNTGHPLGLLFSSTIPPLCPPIYPSIPRRKFSPGPHLFLRVVPSPRRRTSPHGRARRMWGNPRPPQPS